MKGMILAAGYGTRLRPETDSRPKPLFPIGKTTMLKNAIGYLLHHGIDEIAVNIYHLSHMMKKELETVNSKKVTLHVVEETEMMGTAGGIKGAQRFLDGSLFAVVNSDILIDLDLQAAMRYHRDKKAIATLALRENPDPSKIGTLKVDDDGKVVRFLNSTSKNYDSKKVMDSTKMFTGVHIFSPDIFNHISAERPVDISGEVYPGLIESGEPVYGYDYHGYWADIGTPAAYKEARMDVVFDKFRPYSI
ncbi:MAG: NDP-sugar synthase [Nitrospinota bacterium]